MVVAAIWRTLAYTPPNETLAEEEKLPPLMVTAVPPTLGPLLGTMLLMNGFELLRAVRRVVAEAEGSET